jgi:ABC-type polar amino acid transport system ATPase subunit
MVSMGVSLALELRAIRKRFSVGAGPCLASAEVLRGVDLEIGVGESVALVGGIASGKSTLMLCAAGLLRPESGDLKWYGESSRLVAVERVRYYCNPSELLDAPGGGVSRLHLIDLHVPIETSRTIVPWIDERCSRGDSVVVVARDERFARHVAARVLTLSGGMLRSLRPLRARVAEHLST